MFWNKAFESKRIWLMYMINELRWFSTTMKM